MIPSLRSLLLAASLGCVAVPLMPAADAVAEPNVAVSIKPLHSLISAVMTGIGTPYLVMAAGASPHTYSLRPSDARALSEADAVFWIGSGLETFLTNTLETLAIDATIETVSEYGDLTILSYREGGVWSSHDHAGHDEHDHDQHNHDGHDEHAHDEHGHEGHDEHAHDEKAHNEDEQHGHDGDEDVNAAAHDHHGTADMHLWLDPTNAMVIARHAVEALVTLDPQNEERYRTNLRDLLDRLVALDSEINETVDPIRSVPFIVFHDAYQYMEKRYDLAPAGSVTVSPDRQPGAQRVRELREVLSGSGAVCAFSEPQFQPAIIDTLVTGLDIRTGVLDPIGADIAIGPDLYFDLMRNNAASLKSCLSGSS